MLVIIKNPIIQDLASAASLGVAVLIFANRVLQSAPTGRSQATFLMRVRGTSMKDAGIDDGDVVLIDRAIKAVHGHIVVAVVDVEFTVKRLWKRGDRVKLQAENPTYPDIVPKDGQQVEVWGVVTNAIKAMTV